MRARATLLDDGLEQLRAYWHGAFEPRPIGPIPIWVAARYPNRRPLRRAARHDGLFPIDLPDTDAQREMAAEVPAGLEIVVTNPPGTDPAPWEAAGATWCLTGFGVSPRRADVEAAIDAGP